MIDRAERVHYPVPMRYRALAAAVVVLLCLIGAPTAPSAAQEDGAVAPVPGGVQPTPFNAADAAAQAPFTAAGADGSGLAPSGAGTGTFASFRVYATQYNPNTSGSVEVAVPDKCAKFAALRWTDALANHGCPGGYRLDLDYRVVVRRDNGQSAAIPVKEVGPWNVDDNYWAGPGSPRPRRMFTDLPRGVPEAQAARSGYNTVPNCKNLDGTPSGRAGGADQFGRCVLNPAGIDLSVEAARQLGLGYLQNEVVTVTFLWEPLATRVVAAHSNKNLDVSGVSQSNGAPVIQWSPNGGANQLWKFIPTDRAGVYNVIAAHSGKLLDVEFASTANGARTIQWPANGGGNQRWRLRPVAGGHEMVADHSGKALDIEGASPHDGAAAIQWPPHGGANQLWRLTVVS
jgi:hypothetical protein